MILSHALKKYFFTYIALFFFLGLTFLLAHLNLGIFHLPVGIIIGAIKAVLIGLFFMSLKYEDGLHRIFSLSGVFFLFILLSLAMSDLVSRSWLSLPGQFPPEAGSKSQDG